MPYKNKFAIKKMPSLSFILMSLSVSLSATIYLNMGEPRLFFPFLSPLAQEQSRPQSRPPVSHFDTLKEKIKRDTQNGELWFSLGNEYMQRREFENAEQVYQYANKLSNQPDANIFAALASARYYRNKQNIDPQTQIWIEKSLALEPHNPSVHLLLATNNYLQGEYQNAIEHWEKALDAHALAPHLSTLDRPTLIRSIQQANRMLL